MSVKLTIVLAIGLLLMLFIPQNSSAQTQLSGTLGLHYVKQDNTSILYYSVIPKIGFEFSNGNVFGVEAGYQHLTQKSDWGDRYKDQTTKSGQLNFGVYMRFNTTKSEKIRLLLEPSVFCAITSEESSFGYGAAVWPVVQFRISEKLFIDATLGLMGLTVTRIPDMDHFEFNLGLNNNATLPMSYLSPLNIGLTFAF